jgi:hypothetical protein
MYPEPNMARFILKEFDLPLWEKCFWWIKAGIVDLLDMVYLRWSNKL